MGLGMSAVLERRQEPLGIMLVVGCVLGPLRIREGLAKDVLSSQQPPDLRGQLVSGHPEHHGGSWPPLRTRTQTHAPASLVHRG